MHKVNKLAVGRKFRELRKEKGYSCQRVSDELGYHGRGIVSKIERGVSMSFDTILKLCDFYKIDRGIIMKLLDTQNDYQNRFLVWLINSMKDKHVTEKQLIIDLGACYETVRSWLNGASFPSEKFTDTGGEVSAVSV